MDADPRLNPCQGCLAKATNRKTPRRSAGAGGEGLRRDGHGGLDGNKPVRHFPAQVCACQQPAQTGRNVCLHEGTDRLRGTCRAVKLAIPRPSLSACPLGVADAQHGDDRVGVNDRLSGRVLGRLDDYRGCRNGNDGATTTGAMVATVALLDLGRWYIPLRLWAPGGRWVKALLPSTMCKL